MHIQLQLITVFFFGGGAGMGWDGGSDMVQWQELLSPTVVAGVIVAALLVCVPSLGVPFQAL